MLGLERERQFLAVAPAGAVFSWVELRCRGSIVAFGWHSSVLVDQDFKPGVPGALGVLRVASKSLLEALKESI